MDGKFFKGFTEDLHNKNAWKEFHVTFRNEKKKLKNTANPTQLGDHVSMKAEAADSKPTDHDLGAREENSTSERPSLSKLAKDTTIGDPVSLDSEDVVESSENPSPKPVSSPPVKPSGSSLPLPDFSQSSTPTMPSIDGESLFWAMMSTSREPDPYVYPALQRLSKQPSRPILGALSNTVIFPPDHPWSKETSTAKNANSAAALFDPRSFFDVYIASAEVGMRKPSREIYELAVKRLNEFDKQKGGSGVKAEDIVFLDDIGENLKAGKDLGMMTIRVQLGKTWRAVKELEGVLGEGVELMDERTRRSKL